MRIIIDNQIVIQEPTKEVIATIKNDLKVKNPKWTQNNYMGFSNRNVPEYLVFWETDENNYIAPFGYIKRLYALVGDKAEYVVKIKSNNEACKHIENNIKLYDYQEKVHSMAICKKNGIIVMPAGSGKTQTGLKVICTIGHKALWITHTLDLLNQSYTRAKDNGITGLGKIASGKVDIGSNITFATVQTLSKLDLTKYKDTWGTIIVDECHRICGTPAAVTMFYKCISSLSARYKIGLTATPERSQKGTEKAMFALLGEVIAEVPKEMVKKLHASIQPIYTGYELGEEAEKTDGTIDYTKVMEMIWQADDRNELIVDILGQNRKHYCLILGDRISHLESLQASLGQGVVINGKTNKTIREGNLEAIREGREHFLFATFSLAKEGLDIPRLDRLFFVSPRDDKAVIVQSVGRIERCFKDKEQPIVYDFVDNGEYFLKKFKKRKTIYRKNGNDVNE